MSFNELVLTTEKETTVFDTFFDQCVAFLEASYQEYKTNLKEAELKVIQESGTTEDLIYLEATAKDGFIVRSGKAIKKLIDQFLAWITKIIESIQDFLHNEKNKKELDRAEKILKNNPKLKNEKIEVADIEKINKVCGKYEAMVDRKIAMFKAKKFNEKDTKELENIEEEFEKDVDVASKVIITVSVATSIPLLYSILKHLQVTKKNANDIKLLTMKDDDNPEDVEKYCDAVTLKTRIMKEFTNILNNTFGKLFNNIKATVTKSGEINPQLGIEDKNSGKALTQKDDVKVESTINENSYLDNLLSEIAESASYVSTEETDEFDAESYLEALESTLPDIEPENQIEDLEQYLEALEKEICGDDMFDAEQYLESMEEELFNTDGEMTAEEYLESMEAELFGEDPETEEVTEMTAEEYLESMEAELFE